jgi:uncharacterized membrane protein
MRWSISLFVLALSAASVASRGLFSRLPLSSSPVANEILIDLAGISASLLAAAASFFAYSLRANLLIRVYLTAAILLALAFGFEFGIGFIWFALDHFKTFGHVR